MYSEKYGQSVGISFSHGLYASLCNDTMRRDKILINFGAYRINFKKASGPVVERSFHCYLLISLAM